MTAISGISSGTHPVAPAGPQRPAPAPAPAPASDPDHDGDTDTSGKLDVKV